MKKIFTLFIICLMIFLTGCKSEEIKTGITPFIGGKVGLNMEFVEGVPPDQIYDSGSSHFAIGLQLENVGEHYLEDDGGYVEIVGINPNDFNKDSQADLKKVLSSGLRNTKKNVDGSVIEGDKTVVEFGSLKYLPDLRGNTEFKFRANLCYDYFTQTSTKICINKNPLGIIGESICKMTGDKNPQNSGGPIHITKFKESPLGDNRIQLLFEIEHVGDKDDMFYKLGTDCENALTNADKYKVLVKITSDVNGVKPECSGLENDGTDLSEGYVTLFNGKKRAITCTINLDHIDSVFEEIFTVELGYRYHQFVEKTIEVQDVSAS